MTKMDLQRLKMNASDIMDAVDEAIQGALKATWTSMRVTVSKDSDGHVSTLKSVTKLPITQLDGSVKLESFSLFDTSPVHYPNGGGHHFTHPVKEGDEGLVLFTSRDFDVWHEKGGEQDPIHNATHHLAHSVHLPGGRSDPRKLKPAASKVSAQQRSDDGKHVSDVNKDSGITHASEKKHAVLVGGSGGSGTMHLPAQILKNAAKVLINCVQQSPLPPPGASFANKKVIATTPIGAMGSGAGAISTIMQSVMSGGIGALLSSPTSGASSGLLGAITSAASAVSGVGGVSGLTTALGDLTSAVGALESGVSALSGATTPGGGASGLSDVLSHAQSLTQYFGASAPASVSMSTVLAPLQSSPLLNSLSSQVTALAASVVGGSTTPAAAATTVSAMTAQVSALLPAATGALTTLQTALPALKLAALAGSAGVSLDPNELAVAGTLAGPQLAALTSAMAQIFALSASDVASVTAFPDPQGAGATGGVSPS